MVLLVFVHGYNLHDRYMQPWTIVDEPLNFITFPEYFLANGIFRFSIPMLFAISEYLFAMLDDTPHRQRIRKRARTLLLPYFIGSIIGLLIAVLFANWEVNREVVYKTHLQHSDNKFGDYSASDWISAILRPTSFQLWFLRCLFMYNLLYPLLLKGKLKAPKIIFSIFGLLWLTTFGIIFLEGKGLLFFSLGIWLCKNQKDLEVKPKWLNLSVGVFLLAIIAVFKTWHAFEVEYINTGRFFMFSFLHKATILLGLLVIWFGCNGIVKYLMGKPWYIQLTSFSFIIYALRVPLISYFIDLFSK